MKCEYCGLDMDEDELYYYGVLVFHVKCFPLWEKFCCGKEAPTEPSCRTCNFVEIADDGSWDCNKRIVIDWEIDTIQNCNKYELRDNASEIASLHEPINWEAKYNNLMQSSNQKSDYIVKLLDRIEFLKEWIAEL